MLRLFNTALLYLLVLAIPAQGLAASALFYCGPVHQGMTLTQATERHSAQGHANIAAAGRHDHQVPAAVAGALASGGAEDDFTHGDDEPANAGLPGNLSCSACAACCMGAAVTASDRKLAPAAPAIECMASMPLHNTGFVTDGPRRPPRSFSA